MMGAIVTVIGIVTGKELLYPKVTQNTCIHDAKVKMAGYKNMYECTRCHKFVHTVPLKTKENEDDDVVPKYAENGWEDNWD